MLLDNDPFLIKSKIFEEVCQPSTACVHSYHLFPFQAHGGPPLSSRLAFAHLVTAWTAISALNEATCADIPFQAQRKCHPSQGLP